MRFIRSRQPLLVAFAVSLLWVGVEGLATQAAEEIRIGHLVPLTGPIAKSGEEAVRGLELFWEQAGHRAAGRSVRVLTAETGCNPDNAIGHARRLIHQEKVHLIIGPLCGHEAPAVAQVSRETGVPVFLSVAGADELTKWKRVPTVIRTGFSASQTSHPFGDYVAKELGCRNATVIANDFTFGHENAQGAMATFTLAGGTVLKTIWTPIGTTDYGPVLAGIPAGTQCVMVSVVGSDRNRLFEQWFDFGYDRRFKIYGNYFLLADVLPHIDDRAVGLISKSLQYAAGVDTPESKTFVDAFVRKYKVLPAYFAESNYATALWVKTAIEAVNGRVEDREAFMQAFRKATVNAPRGRLRLDAYDNPIQNVYIFKVAKIKHAVLGDVRINVPVKTYEAVSQFWTWKPEEFLARGQYKR